MSGETKLVKAVEKLFEIEAKAAPAEAKAAGLAEKVASEENKIVNGAALVTPELPKMSLGGLAKSAYVFLRTKAFRKACTDFKQTWAKAAEDVLRSNTLQREAEKIAATDAAKAATLRKEAQTLIEQATKDLGEDPRNIPKHILGWLKNQSERVGGTTGGPKTAQAWLEQQLELVKSGQRPSLKIPRARAGATGPAAPPAVKEWLEQLQKKMSQNPQMPNEIPKDVQSWFEKYLNKPRKPSILNPPGYDIGHKEALVLSKPGGPDPNRLTNLRWELGTMNRARGSREKALAEKLGLTPK